MAALCKEPECLRLAIPLAYSSVEEKHVPSRIGRRCDSTPHLVRQSLGVDSPTSRDVKNSQQPVSTRNLKVLLYKYSIGTSCPKAFLKFISSPEVGVGTTRRERLLAAVLHMKDIESSDAFPNASYFG